MRRLVLAILLMLGAPVVALGCEGNAVVPAALEPVPAAVWRDVAKFSFLIGRDDDQRDVRMEMINRFKVIPNFAALRAASAGWAEDYPKLLAATQRISVSASLAERLNRLCEAADRASVSDEPFDHGAWLAELVDIGRSLDGLVAGGTDLNARLTYFSDLLGATSGHYARAGNRPIEFTDIGPDPVAVSAAIDAVRGRWHAITADLAFARGAIPSGSDTDEETIAGLILAAAALRLVAVENRALAINMISPESFATYASGAYFYDACAAAEGRFVELRNRFQPDRVLVTQGDRVLVAPPGPNVATARWRLQRIGNGYWTIENQAAAGKVLDFDEAPASAYPLRMTKANGMIFQRWRCYPSRFSGHFRLSNANLGEARSLDTYNNDPTAILLPTGDFSGQTWQAVP